MDSQPEWDQSIESKLKHLAEMKEEYREKKRNFEKQNKHLLESIKSLENIVVDDVLRLGHTVTADNIKAEYVPQVRIRLKKVKDGN